MLYNRIDPQSMIQSVVEGLVKRIPQKGASAQTHAYPIATFAKKDQLRGAVHSLGVENFRAIAERLRGHPILLELDMEIRFDSAKQAFIVSPRQHIVTVELPA